MAKSGYQLKNSDIKTLLLLPAHREDPAFIMDLDGKVVLSTGKTDRLFQKESIGNIKDVIGVDGFDLVIQTLDPSCTDPETRTLEIYSERLQNWYKIKFKPIVSRCGSLPEKILVWFSEVTAQREVRMRQHDLLNYTGSLMSNVQTLAREKSTYDHLAAYILHNYEGVLITRNDSDGNLNGYVFKQNGEVKRFENIVIAGDCYFPVFLSRHEATVIADDIRNYTPGSAFDQKYSFDERVRSFLDVPIQIHFRDVFERMQN